VKERGEFRDKKYTMWGREENFKAQRLEWLAAEGRNLVGRGRGRQGDKEYENEEEAGWKGKRLEGGGWGGRVTDVFSQHNTREGLAGKRERRGSRKEREEGWLGGLGGLARRRDRAGREQLFVLLYLYSSK
jgi:hypothetical protein